LKDYHVWVSWALPITTDDRVPARYTYRPTPRPPVPPRLFQLPNQLREHGAGLDSERIRERHTKRPVNVHTDLNTGILCGSIARFSQVLKIFVGLLLEFRFCDFRTFLREQRARTTRNIFKGTSLTPGNLHGVIAHFHTRTTISYTRTG